MLSGNAWADLSNEVKWNTNIVIVETAIKAGDYNEAFILLQEPANAGHAKSQYYMGMFYHNGLGVLEDASEAAKWYKLAAEQGDAISQFYLGYFYRCGVYCIISNIHVHIKKISNLCTVINCLIFLSVILNIKNSFYT